MANITAADIKRLRDHTGSGMMAAKQALTDSDGDFDKAVEVLRLQGAKDVGKRAERTADNGLVAVRHNGDGEAVILQLNCETDFVAKTDRFQELAGRIADFAAQAKPADESALLGAEIESGTTVQQAVDEASATIGEKLELSRFAHVTGAYVASYLHKSDPALPPTLGVLLELDSASEQVAKDVAQQIAAMAPKYLSRDDVPEDVVANERRLAEQMAREEGKPEQAVPKIVEGRVNGFFKDFTLLEQPFVKENKKTVGKVLSEAGVTAKRFVRFKVGQA